ncbi:MAG: hypothetical protein IPJ28_20105 [Betaproteobacteria bacterium]|nr:hypothetical protein [Betaproteobacteria bacterium]
MAIPLPGLPGRLPAVPVPATIRPPLPVEPLQPVRERAVQDPSAPPRPPGSTIDTWAAHEAFPATESLSARRPAPVHSSPLARPVMRALPGLLADDLGGPEITGNGAKLAPALRHAIETSGVFYESHLAEWTQGERDTDHLLLEVSNLASRARDGASQGVRDAVRSQQIDFLRQGEVGWMLPTPFRGTTLWVGEPQAEGRMAPQATPLVKLEIDLPGRGTLRVVMRLLGRDLYVDLDGGGEAGIGPEGLLDLGQRLQGLAGLHLAALRTTPVACAKRSHAEAADRCTWTNCDSCLSRGT